VDEDYPAAALRHFEDAEALAGSGRYDNAGHLIGFAAECAVKAAWRNYFPGEDVRRIHFPDLRDAVKRKFSSRRDLALRKVIRSVPDLLSGWDIALRYAADQTIDGDRFSLWKQHACRLLHAAGLKRERQ